MPIETQKTVTATTSLTDDQIIAHLQEQAAAMFAEPAYRPGDVVVTSDQDLIARCQLMRPYGVVVNFHPVDRNVLAMFVNVDGREMALSVRATQVSHR